MPGTGQGGRIGGDSSLLSLSVSQDVPPPNPCCLLETPTLLWGSALQEAPTSVPGFWRNKREA